MPIKFDQFVKLMMMTTSTHDGEVLNAIRMANSMLASTNQNWDELLHSKVRMEAPSSSRPQASGKRRHTDAREIDPMFQELFDTVSQSSSFYKFVESVHTFWEQNGFLTDNQYQAISKAARR